MSGLKQRSANPQPQQRTPAGAADVVILRESEVDGDLASAIARIRADVTTAKSRILIIGPDHEAVVATAAEVAPALPGELRRQAARAALGTLGRRLDPLVGDLDRLLLECGRELGELVEDIDEGTRARLKHRAKVLQEVLTWLGQVAADIGVESGAAVRGAEPIDLAGLCHELATDRQARAPGVRFMVPGSTGVRREPILQAAAVAELIAGTMALVAARIGNAGVVEAQFDEADHRLCLRLAGVGSARPIDAADLIERVRRLAHELDVEIRRDPVQGDAGAAVELSFPLPEA
jgi:hypothetical protein